MDICGDDRFEIIAIAKEHLLDATNVETSEDEMKVLDSFLFRCWQMGWLDRYDRKAEPQTEERTIQGTGDCEHCSRLFVDCGGSRRKERASDGRINQQKGGD